MQCVILWRNSQPGRGGVGFISGDEPENIAVFRSYAAAAEFAKNGGSPVLRAFPYQIVELDDL